MLFIKVTQDDGDGVCRELLVEEFFDVFQKVPSGVGVFSVCQHDLLLSVKCSWARGMVDAALMCTQC